MVFLWSTNDIFKPVLQSTFCEMNVDCALLSVKEVKYIGSSSLLFECLDSPEACARSIAGLKILTPVLHCKFSEASLLLYFPKPCLV